MRRILFGNNESKNNSSKHYGKRRTRKLNEVPDYLRKRRRIAVEQGRGRDMTATNEDRERQAILEEAVEETEHDLEKFRKTAEDLLMQEQEKEDTIYDTMFQASFIEETRVVIKSLSGIGKTAVGLALADLNPDYVVLYDFDISFVRSVEIFAGLNPLKKENCLKVYFLMFAASSEQKVFLKALEREQSAFEKLIHHKKTMPPPLLQVDGTQEMQQALANGSVAGTYKNGTLPLSVDTRRGAGKSKIEKRDIAVDVREFRSALPSILHRGGMRLAPVTLLVGDFVLSNVHCVERKSISDLYGSFASGRLYVLLIFLHQSKYLSLNPVILSQKSYFFVLMLLYFYSLANSLLRFLGNRYNQAEQMSKYYTCPCLLIEFDPAKSFCLQNSNDLGMDIKTDSVGWTGI